MKYFVWLVMMAPPAPAETLFDAGRVREFVAAREAVARARLESTLRAGATTAGDLRVLRARFPRDGTALARLAREVGAETAPPPREVAADGAGYRITTAHGRTFRLGISKRGVTINDHALITTHLAAYLAAVDRALTKTFATAWWRQIDPLPRAHAGIGARVLVIKVAAAAIRLMGLVPQAALDSTTARARATTTWFNQNTVICQSEADQHVPYEVSETKDNVDQLANQLAFARDGATPVNCTDFVKRSVATAAPGKNDLGASDARALCDSAQAFSICIRDYRRRDAGGSKIQPVNVTPAGR